MLQADYGCQVRIKKLPDVEILRGLFVYDPTSGILTNRLRRGPRLAGAEIGGVTNRGYRFTVIDGAHYQVHRIIWKMVTGEDPQGQIDHRDGDTENNRWGNLRPSTQSQNACNTRLRSDSTSGVKGISFDARRNKWRATIQRDCKQYALGRFDKIEDAVAALDAARSRLHGEFARAA